MNESTAICRPYRGRPFRGSDPGFYTHFQIHLRKIKSSFHGNCFLANRIIELLNILNLVQYSYNSLVTEPCLRVIYLNFC